jgi:hypothetical protein
MRGILLGCTFVAAARLMQEKGFSPTPLTAEYDESIWSSSLPGVD